MIIFNIHIICNPSLFLFSWPLSCNFKQIYSFLLSKLHHIRIYIFYDISYNRHHPKISSISFSKTSNIQNKTNFKNGCIGGNERSTYIKRITRYLVKSRSQVRLYLHNHDTHPGFRFHVVGDVMPV